MFRTSNGFLINGDTLNNPSARATFPLATAFSKDGAQSYRLLMRPMKRNPSLWVSTNAFWPQSTKLQVKIRKRLGESLHVNAKALPSLAIRPPSAVSTNPSYSVQQRLPFLRIVKPSRLATMLHSWLCRMFHAYNKYLNLGLLLLPYSHVLFVQTSIELELTSRQI